MAESLESKRPREEEGGANGGDEEFDDSSSKRQKTSSYNHILSILEEDEDEPNQDLSDIFTTLQQELSDDQLQDDPLPSAAAGDGSETEVDQQLATGLSATTSDESECSPGENDEECVIIRHLLEASDDELGIPNRTTVLDDQETSTGHDYEIGGDHLDNTHLHLPFALSDGLWEFEDETANYYALLQSELFM